MTVKIIVADQMDLAMEGIEAILSQQREFEVIGTCQSLTDLLAMLTEQRPDVLLIGDRLELGMDVLSLVRRVQAVAPRTRLIVMSSIPDGLVVHELFACGVTGYLYKNDPLRTILSDAIRAVMGKQPYLSFTANTEYLIAIQSGRAGWQIDEEALDVLRLLANGYQCQEIALRRGMLIRRVYWVCSKLRDRFGAQTNEHMIARAAEEGFLA